MSTEIFQANHSLSLSINNRDGSSFEYNGSLSPIINDELTKSFNVIFSAETLNKIKDFKLAFMAKNTNLKGFRPGKAPLNVVWKQHEADLTSDLVNNVINAATQKILEQAKLEIIASPQINIKGFSFEKGLDFEVTFSLMPKITIPKLEEISLTKPMYEITEADIKERSDQLLTRYKNYTKAPENYKANNGDKIIIDFEGKIDGIAFPGGTAKNHTLELGTKSFIDNFEDQLLNHKADDRALVKVTFPENYHEKKFAGKAAEFSVTINEIQQSTPLTNENDLAKSIGFASAEELKEKIKQSLEKECEEKRLVKMKTELFDKLDSSCDFSIPQILLDDEFKNLWQNVERMRQYNPTEINKPEDELKEEYLKLAKRRVKLGLLLAEIAKLYNVQIAQEDIVSAVRARAMANPQSAQAIIKYYTENPKAVEGLKGNIIEEKAVEYIFGKVINIEKPIKTKDLLEIIAD